MSNLAIDIGNTRTKVAVFDDGRLVHKEFWDVPAVERLEHLAYNQKVENAILSTTAAVPADMEAFLNDHFFYIRLQTGTPLPVTLRYKTPHTLGKDRIAAAAAVCHLFPGEHVLVIDAGTCITMDVVNAAGEFLGGNISPGVEMRLKAMHHFTANLPLVNAAPARLPGTMWLGDSTEMAVRNGGELGALLEVTAFVEKCRRLFEPLRVIFTGGDADFFVKTIKTKIFANPNLVLTGLNKILQHNVEIFLRGNQER